MKNPEKTKIVSTITGIALVLVFIVYVLSQSSLSGLSMIILSVFLGIGTCVVVILGFLYLWK